MKRALIASAVLAVSISASAPLSAQSTAPAAPIDLVVATVNGEPIMESDIKAFYKNLPPQFQEVPIEQIRSQLIERLIEQAIVANAARQEGYHKRPDVQRQLATVTQSILNDVYIAEKIKAAVTDAKVKDQYQRSIALESKTEEVRARHILMKTKSEAMAVIADIKGGADFAAVAKAKSTGPSGRDGGDLGYFSFKQMVPPFSKVAFALKPGEFTTDPVKTQFGWHIIKVEDRRVAGSQNFEQASQKIRQELSQQAYKDTLSGLRAKARIDVIGGGTSKIQLLR